MRRASEEIDSWARKILQAIEPDLRRHLAAGHLNQRLFSDLYLAIRRHLAGLGLTRARTRPGSADDLAMTIYVVVVARSEAEPALLASMTRALTRTLEPPESQPETSRRQTARIPSRRAEE